MLTAQKHKADSINTSATNEKITYPLYFDKFLTRDFKNINT